MKKALLLANGQALPTKQLNNLRKNSFVVALDGAAERCRREKWIPNLILGDMDSLQKSSVQYFRKKAVPIVLAPDQNHSDLEKGLNWLIQNGFTKIVIAQAWGERVDHSIAALALLRKFHHKKIELIAITEKSKISNLQNSKLVLMCTKKKGIAVLPFPRCKVWSKGLEFEMHGVNLELGQKESIANQTRNKKVEIRVRGSALLVEDI